MQGKRNVHRGSYIQINDSTIVKIIYFCFINHLLERVATEKVLNIQEFLSGGKPLTEELIFEFPNIPSLLETVIASYKVDKRDCQCK